MVSWKLPINSAILSHRRQAVAKNLNIGYKPACIRIATLVVSKNGRIQPDAAFPSGTKTLEEVFQRRDRNQRS